MTTRLGRMATYLDGLLPIKSHYSLIKLSPTVLMASKLGKLVACREGLLPIMLLQPIGHVVLRDHVTNENHYISTTTMFIATKRGRMVTTFYP